YTPLFRCGECPSTITSHNIVDRVNLRSHGGVPPSVPLLGIGNPGPPVTAQTGRKSPLPRTWPRRTLKPPGLPDPAWALHALKASPSPCTILESERTLHNGRDMPHVRVAAHRARRQAGV